jgi:hypothetical protein
MYRIMYVDCVLADLATDKSASAFRHLTANLDPKPNFSQLYLFSIVRVDYPSDFSDACNALERAADIDHVSRLILTL